VIAAATGIAAAALSVSPARVRLTTVASRTITITNAGDAATVVNVAPGSLVVDRRGRPAVARDRSEAARWLRLRPRRLVLTAGGTAVVTVSAAAGTAARPGDHAALVLFTTQPPHRAAVGVRMRIGVVVFIRVAGRIVHRLEIEALRARGRVLEAAIANRGNVVEHTRVRITLSRGVHVLARLGSAGRTLLPHARAIARVRRSVGLRGWVTARVEAGTLWRSFRIRL